ncbi:MAG: four helix bundle protein [Calditrichaeota bacterium]|nr:four helix bundle protein [Calditrichota bacterium]MCB9089485.1 four helix bundle protein [Calditrichia bacterium]
MSYHELQIWRLAQSLTTDIHNMTIYNLPGFELYEEGSQIRRSVKSVRSNIVEGYSRRRYKKDFIKFLVYALASNNETIDHLNILWETKSLKNEKLYLDLRNRLEMLGKMLNRFLQSVDANHRY